jgi:spermidine synthase
MPLNFEVLAYEDTSLGILCLRRRLTLKEPQQWVTEITLNHEFLMSSLHTDSERSLATLALQRLTGKNLRVMVGGLGLGYTCAAVIDDPRVAQVQVIEFLTQVIDWLQAGLVPLSPQLADETRLSIVRGDVYQTLLADPSTEEPVAELWDAILIDVDHSPDDPLASVNQDFYSEFGLKQAVRHLNNNGVLALWSYAGNHQLEEAMRRVFRLFDIVPITYENQHVDQSFTDWLFIGQR